MGWLFQRDPVDDPVAHLKRKYAMKTAITSCSRSTARAPQRRLSRRPVEGQKDRPLLRLRGRHPDFQYQKDGFGYKEQDEVMGPNEYDCPQRIMRLLSPLAELPRVGYAADWRARVAARHDELRRRRQRRNSLRVGHIVTLPDAVRFSGDITARSFRVAHFRRRTPIFEVLDRPGFYCRLRSAILAAASIANPHSAEPLPAGA